MDTSGNQTSTREAIEALIRALPAHQLLGALEIVRSAVAGGAARKHRGRRAPKESTAKDAHSGTAATRPSRLASVALCLALVLAACAPLAPATTPTPAPTPTEACDVAAYKTEMEPIVDEWNDALELANQTPRIQLAAQVSGMQALRRTATRVATGCTGLDEASTLATFAMQKQIDAFLAFMAEKSDADVASLFSAGDHYWEAFADKLDTLD